MQSRYDAVQSLLQDEVARNNKAAWKEVLEKTDLEPDTETKAFADFMYATLQKEMQDGYARKKQRKRGTTGKFSENPMHISPGIGRYIYAVFRWHQNDAFPEKADELIYMAQAFGFKVNPAENKLQKLNDEDRVAALKEKFNEDDKEESRAFFWSSVGLFISMVLLVLGYYRRKFY